MQEFLPDSPLVRTVIPSPNFDERTLTTDIVLLHYTGMDSTPKAIEWLCDPRSKVSSHYVVTEDGGIVQLVPEERRAWHAGVSSWEGMNDVNSRSIGIEIGHPGHAGGYPEFPDVQIAAVIALCRDLVARHRVRGDRVLGHSDVAPLRKWDPGEKFPWERLHRAGVGAWVEPAPDMPGPVIALSDTGPEVAELQAGLRVYGYGVEASGNYDEVTAATVAAFQRHFRPARVDGRADPSTVETLRLLLATHDRWRWAAAGGGNG